MDKNFLQFLEEPKNDTRIISMSLEGSLVDQMDILCKMNNISRSFFIREAIKLAFNESKRLKKKGFVYFALLEHTNMMKIGQSKRVQERLEHDLGTKFPMDLIPFHVVETDDMDKTERAFHHFFREKRKGSTEWFVLDEEDKRWVLDQRYIYNPDIQNTLTSD